MSARSQLILERAVPLAPLTTFSIGGPARYLARAREREQVAQALAWARAESLPVLVLGGGSNVLVADAGFDGLVLKMEIESIAESRTAAEVELAAGAGVAWDGLVERAVDQGWAGLECLSGIPGSVGAAPIQNIGAYGQEISRVLVGAVAVDRLSGETLEMSAEDCGFGYRTSHFKDSEAGRRLVLVEVKLRLTPGSSCRLPYDELDEAIAERGISRPGPADVRAVVLALRRRKAMLAGEAPAVRSAGSFFLNPVLTKAGWQSCERRAREAGALGEGEALPAFATAAEQYKVSAAWLIERSGFPRGTRRGPVGLSERHALAIVNHGGATAGEVLELARAIRDAVEGRFGVRLVPEPVLVGLAWD